MDPLSLVDPEIASLLGRTGRQAPRFARQRQGLSGDEEQSLIEKLRDGSIGTLAAVGNVLDIPGSMLRDVVSGQNPFDQLLTPTRSDNRVTGREMLRNVGLAGRRDSIGNAIGGFATEVLFDPLTYLTFGGSALTKAGRAAKGAGLFDEIGAVAAKKAGKNIGQVGKREARVGTTIDDIIKYGSDEARVKANAIKSKGGVAGDQSLGGVVGVGIPFMDPVRAFGSGNKSAKVARAMDEAGAFVGGLPVVNQGRRMLDATVQETKTRLGQAAAKTLFRAREKSSAGPMLNAAKDANRLYEVGKSLVASGRVKEMGPEQYARIGDTIRDLVEGTKDAGALDQYYKMSPAMGDAVRDIVGRIKTENTSMARRADKLGIPFSELEDDYVEYMARFIPMDNKHKSLRGRKMFSFNPEPKRLDEFRNIQGGTATIRSLAQDSEINDIIKKFQETGPSKGGVDAVAAKINEKYGSKISDRYKVWEDGEWKEINGRHKVLARRLSSMSEETRKAGIYGNNPLRDHEARTIAFEDSVKTAETLLDTLSQPNVLENFRDVLGRNETHVKLDKAVKDLGYNWDKFSSELAIKSGLGKDALDGLGVTREFADDMARMVKLSKTPEAVNEIVKVADNILNLSKGMWTSAWPAFHTRNLLSGTVHNVLLGITGVRSQRDAWGMMRGREIKGAKDIPAVIAEWNRRNSGAVTPPAGPAKQLTDTEATKILGELAYANKLLGKFEGNATSIVGPAGNVVGGSLEDLMSGVIRPGDSTLSVPRVMRKAVGLEEGTNLNPAGARGVGGRTESTFGPLAAGEEVGHFVEGNNRLGPFIHLLRKGYDPAEAAKVVGNAQIMYSNRYYTPVEQQAFSRFFPFWKFSKNIVPQVMQQLTERPGGRLAQLMRAQRTSQEQGPLAPDYVRETASIPVAGNPLLEALIGKAPAGTDRYIAGLGLMHEDPFSFGPTVKGAGTELLSRSTPFVKAPLEYLTGKSFFQKNADGSGRNLEDLDPVLGRLLTNVGIVDEPENAGIPQWLETLASNSPAARGLTTVRQWTDPRKRTELVDAPIPGVPSMLNTLTGVRVTDVSPGAKDALVRDLLTDAMKDADAATFERVYFRKEDLDKMSPAEKEEAMKLQALANLLAKRAKERKLEKQKNSR